jgi:regulator of replication initiation timing
MSIENAFKCAIMQSMDIENVIRGLEKEKEKIQIKIDVLNELKDETPQTEKNKISKTALDNIKAIEETTTNITTEYKNGIRIDTEVIGKDKVI